LLSYYRNFSFEDVNVKAAQSLARLARENGVSKFIHLSAMSASESSPSMFLRTKAQGEKEVLREFPTATIVRPSKIFGHEDRFMRQIGFMANWIPGSYIPIVSGGHQKTHPVYVNYVDAGRRRGQCIANHD
jgi:NADH dehydrogenase (ubiquinone) 1 alpha subcomplex subunit 9